MEITEINILSDFQAGMKCLQNPSSLSRFFPISGIEKVPQAYNFWKWGALILAIVATFSSIINRIKLLIFRVCRIKSLASSSSSSSSQPLLQTLDDEFDWSEDDTSSSSAASDDEEFESTSSFEDRRAVDEDFRVKGSSCCAEDKWQNRNLNLRRRRIGGHRFSWSDFAAGKSVVQLWDSFGLGLDFEDSFGSEFSFRDLNKDQIPAVGMSPAVVLSARPNDGESIVFGAYDSRIGCQIPAIFANWRPQPRRGQVVGISSGGGEKVYVRDGVTGAVTVGDMRNVKAPLENFTESDVDTWWDADAVVIQNEL